MASESPPRRNAACKGEEDTGKKVHSSSRVLLTIFPNCSSLLSWCFTIFPAVLQKQQHGDVSGIQENAFTRTPPPPLDPDLSFRNQQSTPSHFPRLLGRDPSISETQRFNCFRLRRSTLLVVFLLIFHSLFVQLFPGPRDTEIPKAKQHKDVLPLQHRDTKETILTRDA